jgi:peptidoglycan/xylan/chitin deacetylase (PgdA/CDA1 family)
MIVIDSILSLGVLLGLYFILPYCARNHLRRKFLLSIKESDLVCLTFDDGPNPESTPEILELLEELDVKATFFLIGRNIQKHPELCREIIKHDHEVGDHGYRHVHPWGCLPFSAVKDLIRGRTAIKEENREKNSFWLRPPYGKLNLITLCYVLLYQRRLAFWNVDPQDYLPQPPEKLSASVLAQFKGGSVILLHETSLHANQELEGKLTAIKMTVQEIKNRGYRFVRLSEAVPARD